ncbi:MAG: hypothetical protein V2I33_21875, partial [Kangiellaceae bacterium]|nr:hypothetical protein [Kangiellaceae bacterium]
CLTGISEWMIEGYLIIYAPELAHFRGLCKAEMISDQVQYDGCIGWFHIRCVIAYPTYPTSN